jgi:hypothetical protein
VLTPLGGQSSQLLLAAPPATSPPPPWGLEAGRPCRMVLQFYLPTPVWVLQFYLPTPVWPLAAPPPHSRGEGSEPAGRPGHQRDSNLHLSLPPEPGPARPPGLTLSEPALDSANRRLLGPQVPQLPQLQIFWPCTTAAVRVVLRPELILAARQEYKSLSLRAKSQHPPPQLQDAAAAVALVDAVRPAVLQCPPAPLTRQSFRLRHRPGPIPRRQCRLRPSPRHQNLCRHPRHRPRSGRGRLPRGAVRSSS